MDKEDKRKAFEEACKLPEVMKHVVFPLSVMEINGQFYHYMDSDTDSAWIGFQLGMTAQKKLNKG